MAKAKVQPTQKNGTINGTIKRSSNKAVIKPTPEPSDIEKTQSFTAVFANDAHTSADAFAATVEVVSVEESSAGDAGTKVTVTYK